METGLVTLEELASGTANGLANTKDRNRVLKPDDVAPALMRGSPATAPAVTAPRFQAGDRVRANNRNPIGHTREPRYVRGRIGVIHEHHGAYIYPDNSAAGGPVTPPRTGMHLYTVRFTGTELWGREANSNSVVYVDLWEDYLEPA